MERWLIVLLAAACVMANIPAEKRKTKLPYVADAVGNEIPAPSNGPAVVGSPGNLLTPDRYEFYTFDESGELVKRLMTLEEIQAIVAAGEGSEGHLVTFANDNQPSIAFNFSQAPFTKVHSVVTNVQNVLKQQMEAQKNNPPPFGMLDTPDVSDSWSLILPTIFGNTGADITPDKTSMHTVPETDTLELENLGEDDENLSKEGSNQIPSYKPEINYESPVKLSTIVTEKTQSTTERAKLSSSTTTNKPRTTSTTTTLKPRTTITTSKPRTTTTTSKPRTNTTTLKPRTTSKKPIYSTTNTTKKFSTITTTTKVPSTTSTSTTSEPRITSTSKPVVRTTVNIPKVTPPRVTSKRPSASTTSVKPVNEKSTSGISSTQTPPKTTIEDKVFIPVSTIEYVSTERVSTKVTDLPKSTHTFASTTKRSVTTKPKVTTAAPLSSTKAIPSITTYKPLTSTSALIFSTVEEKYVDNATTVTTQSVSPSTTISSTEFMSTENKILSESNTQPSVDIPETIPMFDVAQSISQIASDLGNYQNPTSTTLLDNQKDVIIQDLESKENLDIEIPPDTKNYTESVKTTEISAVPPSETEKPDVFVRVSTIDPAGGKDSNISSINNKMGNSESNKKEDPVAWDSKPVTSTINSMDPILSESMDDLLSQIVNPAPQGIVQDTERTTNFENISTSSTTQTYDKTTQQKSTPMPPGTVTEKKIYEIAQESNKKVVTLDLTKSSSDYTSPKPLSPADNKIDTTKSHHVNKKHALDAKLTTTVLPSTVSSTSPFPKIFPTSTEKTLPVLQDEPNYKVSSHRTQDTDKYTNDTLKTKPNQNKSVEDTETSTSKVTFINTDIKEMSETNNINAEKIKNPVKISHTEEKDTDFTKETIWQNKDKSTDLLPKIEEFKKKIQKVNIDDKELANERNSSWKLISTVAPPKPYEIPKDKHKGDSFYISESEEAHKDINLEVSKENQGLEVTTKDLGEDIAQFSELCNELAFRYWNTMIENIDKKRSFVLSPYSITSMLAMMFMGARGATSGEMNEILKLDDMVTFNPHFTLKNISDSIDTTGESGVAVSAFIRELYSDRTKGKILSFYKERAQHFYNGHVEEINFKLISDVIRRRTNLLVKRYTWGKIVEFMKTNSITMQPPLAAFSTNIFQTDCTGTSVDGRDGEMYFVVSPTVRQRRLVPVPAVVYKKGFLAGYDPVLDATAAALGGTNSIVSTLFLMPGQQGNVVNAEDLEALEKRLLESNPTTPVWNRLLRTLLPRIGLELQIPRFSHKSIFNISSTLKEMGLNDLFDAHHADLGGLNGPSKDLYLSDMIQLTSFGTCGEGSVGEQHHIEEYPDSLEVIRSRRTSRWASGWDEPRDYQRAFHDPHDVGDAMNLPLHLRPRQARLPARNSQPARLKFDRPFLFFVRHNPSGMILYVGRYNPRLLP